MALVFVALLVVRATQPPTRTRLRPSRHHRRPPRPSPARPLGIPGQWRLVLDSPFTNGRLNESIWRPGWFGQGVTGPINAHESACYSPANVHVARHAGLLLRVSRVTARCEGRSRPYTGAVLSTNPHDGRAGGGFSYRFGVLEARLFVPAITRAGVTRIADWPAVVTLGQVWPRDGENDVFENRGGLVCAHFHSPGYAPGGNLGGCDPTFTPGWHVVSADWEPGQVTWYYDGVEIARADRGITAAPMYIVLVNSTSARTPEVSRPDGLRVAYVRVWQRKRPAGRLR